MNPSIGDTVLVTGASSGIGRAVAVALAAEGVTLHLVGRDPARLAEVAAGVTERGARALTHAFDLTRDDDLRALVAAFAETSLSVLVHAAGIARLGRTQDATLAELDLTYQVNVRAPYALTQALLPALTRARGQIVFINSGAGLNARAGWGQYAISKFGLRAFADALREELKPTGVRVISLYPGRTATAMQADVHAQEGRAYDPARFIQPEHLATLLVTALAMPPGTQVQELTVRHTE